MQHFLITVSYVGTRYHGFQVQTNALSVCTVLQDAMEKLFGSRPDVKGCSRTDAGVHALGYCVSFFAPKAMPAAKLPLALNRYLPHDVRVISAREVPQDFHARYSAQSKEYIYRIRNSAVDNPFDTQAVWRVSRRLDVQAMQQAARYAEGTHSFAAFMSAGSKITDTVRTVHFFTVTQQDDIITCHICADGYLYNMVRILVGTLIEAGTHRMPPQRMQEILASGQRSQAGDTAPACGLLLYRVNYSTESITLDNE